MLSNEGQVDMLKTWAKDGPKFMMLLNMSNVSREDTLKTVNEVDIKGYERAEIKANEWSVIQLANNAAEIISTEKSFGPFMENFEVTHIGLCSSKAGTNGDFFLFQPIESFVQSKQARQFGPGEVYMVRLISKIQ